MATRNRREMGCWVAARGAMLFGFVLAIAVGFAGIVAAGEVESRKTDAALQTLPSDKESLQARITYRYSDPKNVRLLNEMTAERGMAVYMEVQRMIDARHVSPTTYDARVRRSVSNLMEAIENAAFLKANGVSPSEDSVKNALWALNALLDAPPVQTANDSYRALAWVSEVCHRYLNLRPAAVAMEFVNGSVESLDKFSGFVPPSITGGPSVGLEDHVVGIGVEIESHESGIRVLKVLAEGPAYEAGLKKGDLVVSVDDTSLEGKSLNEIVELITGKSGTRVTLGVVRDGEPKNSITMVRRSVPLKSVSEVSMIGDAGKIGYIKLEQFSQSSADELDKAMQTLYQQGMESLVLDLRGNPGGLLTSAIAISDMFLPHGTIVSTRGRNTEDNTLEVATFNRTWKIPLVVLIDENSASASEIFAAAIQENKRGVVVGRHSYGKGTVQTHFALNSVSASLKLTTARFYSPIGRQMAGEGVEPDVRVNVNDTDIASNVDRDIEAALVAVKGGAVLHLASDINNHPSASRNPS